MVKKVGQDKTVYREATCKQCSAKLLYLPIEVQSEALYSMGEYDSTYRWIVCPDCDNKVSVN